MRIHLNERTFSPQLSPLLSVFIIKSSDFNPRDGDGDGDRLPPYQLQRQHRRNQQIRCS